MEARIPYGKGIALRDDMARTGPIALTFLRKVGARWATVNVGHLETAKFLHSQGIDVWMFANPEKFTLELWRGTLVRLEAAANEVGCRQVLPDVEWAYENPRKSWALAPVSEWRALAQALNEMMRRGISIGFTTYDSLRSRVELYIARVIGPLGAWAAPQTYDHELGEVFTRPWSIYKKWKRGSWADIIPFVGSLAPPHGSHEFRSFQGYYQAISLNPWRGAIVWYDNLPAPVGAWLATIAQWTVIGTASGGGRSGGGGIGIAALLLLTVSGLVAMLLKK